MYTIRTKQGVNNNNNSSSSYASYARKKSTSESYHNNNNNSSNNNSRRQSKGGFMSVVQKLLEGKKSLTPEPAATAAAEEARKNSAAAAAPSVHRPSKIDEENPATTSQASAIKSADDRVSPSVVIADDGETTKRSPPSRSASQQPEAADKQTSGNAKSPTGDTASSSHRMSLFSKVFASSKSKSKSPEKKYLDEFVEEDGTKLPMVKFDSEGDFFKEPLEVKINKMDNQQQDSQSHIIRIGNKFEIDTKKVKKYLKRGFKFAFSQIGLAGLVIGYVILGALMFMKIESEYEKENQNKIERNREEFFESVKITAEMMFNEYLKSNFHMKYNKYRNEEIILREDEESLRKSQQYGYISSSLRPSVLSTTTTTTANPSFLGAREYYPGRNRVRRAASGESIRYDRKSMSQRSKPSWYIELDRDLFYRNIKDHLKKLSNENDKIEDKDKPTMLRDADVWNYPNALLYSATVITTIGYGNITPKSNAGKILTIFYAMIGIPLMFMCLTNTGDLLAELFISSYSKCIRFFYRRIFKHKLKIPYSSSKFQENKEEMLNEFEMEYDNPNDRHVPIVATLGVLTAYILAGAFIFSITEEWTILNGAYFCFITFTTIGFGDFVPGKNLESDKGGVAALCALYLLVGMVIMAMCFKLMQDEVVSKARWFGQRLGIIEK